MSKKKIIESLNPISKYLIEFLEVNISHKIGCFQKTKFSIDILTFFYLLFERMVIANQELKKSSIQSINLTNLSKGHDYSYVDSEIKSYIEDMQFIGKQYIFNINQRTIQVNMFCENNCSEVYLKHSIEKIFIWLHVAFGFSNPECSQSLTIFIYLTDLEKDIPLKNHTINRINVNTGFTFSCKSKNEINIYRKEEWFKVLIHESFHNLGLDFSHHQCSHIDSKILSIFPVNADVRIYETYCEMWAEIINIMFIVFNKSTNKESIENMIKNTEKLLDYERTFSLFQCVKVLKHMGISYNELHDRSEKSHIIRNLRYKEKTCVLSYYVLKSILMYKINNFLEWCIKNNGYSIKFSETNINQNMDSYFDLIREHHLDKRYVLCIKNLDEWFNKQEKTKRKQDIELRTLRMSVFES